LALFLLPKRASSSWITKIPVANTHSHEPQLIVNNVVALAKTAKVFGVSTSSRRFGGARRYIIKGIQDVFPHQNRSPHLDQRVAGSGSSMQ